MKKVTVSRLSSFGNPLPLLQVFFYTFFSMLDQLCENFKSASTWFGKLQHEYLHLWIKNRRSPILRHFMVKKLSKMIQEACIGDDDSLIIMKRCPTSNEPDLSEIEEIFELLGLDVQRDLAVGSINQFTPEPPFEEEAKKLMDPGLCGLVNLGETCYMNSVLQCLANLKGWMDFFTKGNYRQEGGDPSKMLISNAYAAINRAIWSGCVSEPVSTKDFHSIFTKLAPQLKNGQQDASQFLELLLVFLNDEMTPKNRQRNSIVFQLFGGEMKSHLKCLSCSMSIYIEEPFLSISLEIPIRKSLKCYFRSVDPNKVLKTGKIEVTDKKTTIGQIRQKCSKLFKVKENAFFFCGVDSYWQIRGVYTADEQPWTFDDSERIICFEIPPKWTEKTSLVIFNVSSRLFNTDVFYPPFIFEIPRRCTSEVLASKAFQCFEPFLRTRIGSLFEYIHYNFHKGNVGGELQLLDTQRRYDYNKQAFPESDCNIFQLALIWRESASQYIRESELQKTEEVAVSSTSLMGRNEPLSLTDCFQSFMEMETLSGNDAWKCEKCGRAEKSTKQIDITKTSQYLVVHLKRFQCGENGLQKLSTFVSFPTKTT